MADASLIRVHYSPITLLFDVTLSFYHKYPSFLLYSDISVLHNAEPTLYFLSMTIKHIVHYFMSQGRA